MADFGLVGLIGREMAGKEAKAGLLHRASQDKLLFGKDGSAEKLELLVDLGKKAEITMQEGVNKGLDVHM